jgi:Holliday junction DNA helicase RuvA
MIGFLKGKVISRTPERLLIDVNGIGFSVWITLNTYYSLKEEGDVFIHTYQHVSDEEISLYGFINENEKRAFEMLLKVQGIGPKLARNILSGINADELTDAIAKKDMTRLLKIPGVGKKLAEKIIFTLKDYWQETVKTEHEEVWVGIRSSLTNLGFKSQEVEDALKILKEKFEKIDLENGVREALRILGGRVKK